jgi:hypothetical protein
MVARTEGLRKQGIAERTHLTMNSWKGCSRECAPVAFSSVSNHSKAWTLTDELKPADIERLRVVLKPRRERYGFAYTMNRWAELALDAEPPSDPRSERSDARPVEGPFSWLEDGADLVAELLKRKERRKKGQALPPPNKRGRPRVDRERWAAVLLGHIFDEFAEARPTRVWNPIEAQETSPFYHFAAEAFQAIGLEPSDQAFRDVCEAWEKPTDEIEFSREAIGKLLWGGPVPGD